MRQRCLGAARAQHGLNANLVHRWRRTAATPSAQKPVANPTPAHSFVALPVTPSPSPPAEDLVIELRLGTHPFEPHCLSPQGWPQSQFLGNA